MSQKLREETRGDTTKGEWLIVMGSSSICTVESSLPIMTQYSRPRYTIDFENVSYYLRFKKRNTFSHKWFLEFY